MTGVEDAQATFTDIADAIRSKTGKSATMKITDMAEEIRSIPTGEETTLIISVKNQSSVQLVGATVVVSYSGGSDLTGNTGSEGTIIFSVKPGYDYTAVASYSGYISNSQTIHVDASGGSGNITLGLKPVVTVVQNGGTGTIAVSGGAYTDNQDGTYTLDSVNTTYTFVSTPPNLYVVDNATQTANLQAGETKTITYNYTAYPTVTVQQSGGTGTVSCSPQAQQQSGNVYTLIPGTSYTFSVTQVALHVKPANQTVSYNAGTTNTITFTHVQYPTVTVSQTGATGTITCSPTQQSQSGNVYTLNPNTNYTFSVSAVANYFTPNSQTVSYNAGTTNNISFAYTAYPVVNVTVHDSSNTGQAQGLVVYVGSNQYGATTTAVDSSSATCTVRPALTGVQEVYLQSVPTGASVSQVYTDSMVAGGTYSVDIYLSFGYGFAQVDIQISTSDPSSRCSYPATITVNNETVNNSCYNFTPAKSSTDNFDMGSWATHRILDGIKPVSFDGTTWTDLDTDASKWTDTTNDIFTEFPFQWLSITNDGTKIRIIFSDKDTQPDSTFQCYAHAKACDSYSSQDITSALSSASRTSIMGGTQNNYFANSFHIGCFDASGGASGAQVYSKKDQTAQHVAYAYFFKGANARGSEYDIMSFQQWTYLQALFVLLYKSTNSQTAHSHGLAKVGSESLSVNNTNNALATTQYGMAGKVGTAQRNAFFWIHDLWGNIYQFIGGLWNRAQSTKYLYYWLPRQSNSRAFNNGWTQATTDAKQTGMGEQQVTTQFSSSSGGFINTVYGTNVAGFAPASASGGSQTTYYSDYGNVYADTSGAFFPVVGGSAGGYAGVVGIFRCDVNNNSTYSSTDSGSRLSYRGGRT